jgi:hypothetical protein
LPSTASSWIGNPKTMILEAVTMSEGSHPRFSKIGSLPSDILTNPTHQKKPTQHKRRRAA